GSGHSLQSADHVEPHRGCADVGAQIDARALFFQPAKVAVKIAPIDGEVVVLEKITALGYGCVILRRDGPAFTGDAAGDPLGQLADSLLINQQVGLRLLQHVNKAGSNNEPFSVNHAFGGGLGRRAAEKTDAVAGYTDIRINPWVAGTVHDTAVTDQDVVLLREESRRRQQQHKSCSPPFHGCSITEI